MKKKEKEEKKIKEVAKKEKEIEILERRLKEAEAISASKVSTRNGVTHPLQELNLVPLSDATTRPKYPKAEFAFPEASISQTNVTEICLSLQGKLTRIPYACTPLLFLPELIYDKQE